jgi:UDPglucose 6-dehydrogenase
VLKGRTIALWGLRSPNRRYAEAPAITTSKNCARVQAYDPEAMRIAKGLFGDRIKYAQRAYEALTGADALALITEWHEFREPDFARMRKLMRAPVVFDGRNIYNREQMKSLGFTYFSIGR